MNGGIAIVLAVLGCLLMMGTMVVLGRLGLRRRGRRRGTDQGQPPAAERGISTPTES